ncbi:MAG TPA: OmpA family protein [Allosphingosinicella sp.]|jgi:outer membrane protein OmpA-like peptidoglycan-associated protein
MRKIVWTLAAAMALPAPALAQERPTRSVDDYVCTFSDDCAEAQAPAPAEATTTKGRARVSSTRGFSLARPKAATVQGANKATASAPRVSPSKAAPRTPGTKSASASGRRAGAATPAAASRPSRRAADLRLTFETGSANLTEQAREEARVFAEALKTPQLGNKRFIIEGHTDSVGGRAYNLELSRRRAQAVVDYLTSLGVERNRFEVRGYGFDKPLDGRSAAAQENRRVEAVLAS